MEDAENTMKYSPVSDGVTVVLVDGGPSPARVAAVTQTSISLPGTSPDTSVFRDCVGVNHIWIIDATRY